MKHQTVAVENALSLPARMQKPRDVGITMLMDTGMTVAQLESYLDSYSEFVDFAKFGIGSAYITPNIVEKITLYQRYGVIPYFGGTLFEKYYHQDKVDDYFSFIARHGVYCAEISCGTIDIPLKKRVDVIRRMRGEVVLLAEIGNKDSASETSTDVWLEEAQVLLSEGCNYVITEGRNTASAGIYAKDGTPLYDRIDSLIRVIGPERLIFEAPTSNSRLYFIEKLGSDVNLGNVLPDDLLFLESERCGLRCETFFLT